MINVNSEQLSDILSKTIPARLPTLVTGSPGIGKTDVYKQVSESLGYDFVCMYPSTLEPTDVSGMPVPVEHDNGKKIERLLDDMMHQIVSATKPTLVLFDELGQAGPAMQAAIAPVLLARRLGKYKVPDCVSFAAATNRRTDRAGASPILTHLISRMAFVCELNVSITHWALWAIKNKIRSEAISFLRFRSALLNSFDAEKSSSGIEPYPNPRSWMYLSRLMDAGIGNHVERETFSGCVGVPTATEFMTHLYVCRESIDIDEYIKNPSSLKMPKEHSAKYAVASGLAVRASKETAGAVLECAQIIAKKDHGEYAMLCVRDALHAFPGLSSTPEWSSFCFTDLGKHILHV